MRKNLTHKFTELPPAGRFLEAIFYRFLAYFFNSFGADSRVLFGLSYLGETGCVTGTFVPKIRTGKLPFYDLGHEVTFGTNLIADISSPFHFAYAPADRSR